MKVNAKFIQSRATYDDGLPLISNSLRVTVSKDGDSTNT